MDLIDGVRRGAAKFFRVHLLMKRRCANQMMGSFRKRCRIGLPGQKIEAVINLECVRVDDFATNFARDIGCQLGFTGSGRADDEECALHKTNCRAFL
jgi:hypothetical protein